MNMRISDIILRISIMAIIFGFLTVRTVLEDRRERLKIEQDDSSTDVIKIRLEDATAKALNTYVQLHNISRTEVIKTALEAFLEDHVSDS